MIFKFDFLNIYVIYFSHFPDFLLYPGRMHSDNDPTLKVTLNHDSDPQLLSTQKWVQHTCNSFSLWSTSVVSVVSVPATLETSSSLSSSSLVPLLPLLPDKLDPGEDDVPDVFLAAELLLLMLLDVLLLAVLLLLEESLPLEDLTYRTKLALTLTQPNYILHCRF